MPTFGLCRCIYLHTTKHTQLKKIEDITGMLTWACKPFTAATALSPTHPSLCAFRAPLQPSSVSVGPPFWGRRVHSWPWLLHLLPSLSFYGTSRFWKSFPSSRLVFPERAAAEVRSEGSGLCGQWCGWQITPAVITGSSREGDGQVGLTAHLSFSDCKNQPFFNLNNLGIPASL